MKVKAKRPVTHAGKSHQAGDVFDVPDHEAKNLIQGGHVEEHTGEEDDPSSGKKSGGSSGTPPFSTGGTPSGGSGKP